MVIIKGALNARYGNNPIWNSFIIQDTVINAIIEVSYWSIIATCLLSVKPLILSATLLNKYSDIIFLFFKKLIGLRFFPVTFSNCTGIGDQTPESYQKFGLILYIWYCYEEWSCSYLGISPQYSLTLVCHFWYFVILGYSP